MAAGLYIHIPFCRRKCPYCDFYSVGYNMDVARAYIDMICGQIEKLERPVSTIFVGGGTPTVMGPDLIKKLLRALGRFTGQGKEFTVEANPESLSAEKLALFAGGGVNRLSIGVQSFDDKKLKTLGRIHDSGRAVDAVFLSRKKGFKNIGIDLIFGAPGETLEDYSRDLKRAAEMPVTHISCYCLTYEKGTPLFEAKKKGKIMPVDEEFSARVYSRTIDLLPRHGFRHYEVSNFAKSGFACRHNLNYWNNGEYFGLGSSAVSYIGGIRRKNIPDVREYIKRAAAGQSTTVSSEQLAGERKAKEAAAIKIRTAEGIPFDWFKGRTGYDFLKLESDAIRKLSGIGLIKYRMSKGKKTGIALTKKGFLFCDTASSELL